MLRAAGKGGAAGRRFIGRALAATMILGAVQMGPAWTAPTAASATSVPMYEAAAPTTSVMSSRVIGYSVQHRPIVAYELGDPLSPFKAVVLGSMHGYWKQAGQQVTRSLRNRPPIHGVDLWVIDTINPDGNALHQRANAHNVDLNRNWPYIWQFNPGNPSDLFDNHASGPSPLSEPETIAMYNFLRWLGPARLVSLHQPLDGVDTTDGGAKDPAFRNALATNLGLPLRALTCFGGCHGNMTGWQTHYTTAVAITVEFGASPDNGYLAGRAAGGVLSAIMLGHSAAAPRVVGYLDTVTSTPGVIRVAGWSVDPQRGATSNTVVITVDGKNPRTVPTSVLRSDVNRARRITGRHGFTTAVAATPGRHLVCVTGSAANSNSAATNLVHSCHDVTVPPWVMRGRTDRLVAVHHGFRAGGWTDDPQHPTSSQHVQIKVDGKVVVTLTTTVGRPDVNRALGISGIHGFDTVVQVAPGVHTVTITAVATASTTHSVDLVTTKMSVPA